MAQLLIADDIAISRETLARVLREAGHRVTAAASGAEALERARLDPPALAIFDLNMPGLNGLETAEQLKATAPGLLLPVMIVSGRALSAAELAEVLAVADDFVRKPILPAEVCARVEVWLRVRRLFEEARGRSSKTPVRRAQQGSPMMERIADEWKRAMRWNEPFALLLCEAISGATAPGGLAELMRMAATVLRQVDYLGEVGPAQVGVLLPRTPPAGALRVAERLMREISGSGAFQVAMGMALVPGRDIAGPEELMKAATKALQRALAEGPGGLCLHQHQGYLVR